MAASRRRLYIVCEILQSIRGRSGKASVLRGRRRESIYALGAIDVGTQKNRVSTEETENVFENVIKRKKNQKQK